MTCISRCSPRSRSRAPISTLSTQALTRAQPTATGDGPFRERLKGYGIDTGAPGEVLWNFEKFLVNRQGQVVGRFAPDTERDDPKLLAAIDAELAKQ